MQGYDIESNKRLMQFNEKNSRTGTILSTAGSMLGAYGSYGGAGGMGKMTPSSAAPLSQNTSFSPASFNLAPTSYNVRIGG
jgi:hypothetical protein